MKYNINELYDWPIVPKAIVMGLICLVLLYLAYFLDFSDFSSKLSRLDQQEQDLKMQLSAISSDINNVKVELSEYPTLMKSLIFAQRSVINTKQLPELLNDILKIGRENELEFNQFNPGTEIKEGNYIKVPIKAVVLGTYDQIANFISQIANMNKIVSVSYFSVGKQPKQTSTEPTVVDGRLIANITLDVYEVKKP